MSLRIGNALGARRIIEQVNDSVSDSEPCEISTGAKRRQRVVRKVRTVKIASLLGKSKCPWGWGKCHRKYVTVYTVQVQRRSKSPPPISWDIGQGKPRLTASLNLQEGAISVLFLQKLHKKTHKTDNYLITESGLYPTFCLFWGSFLISKQPLQLFCKGCFDVEFYLLF